MTPFLRWVEDDEATGHLAKVYDEWRSENPGRTKIPDILKCFSLRPDFLEAAMRFSYDLHFANGFLTRRQKELIGTYVSALNQCPYCRGSHAYFLECQTEAKTANAVRTLDLDDAEITDAERMLLEFAGTLTRESHTVRQPDVDRLRDAGWTDKQIAEAVYVTAMFALFNRIANAFGLVDPNYHEVLGGKDVPNRSAYRDDET
ncbi:MAG: peroxidase-related enzyme [Planctomycetaceae bacterium]